MHLILDASSIGSLVYPILSQPGQGKVIGLTSHGVFLQPVQGRVAFISYDDYRGPLTVNVPDGRAILSRLENGTIVDFRLHNIIFPQENFLIRYSKENIWEARFPDFMDSFSKDESREKAERLMEEIMQIKPNLGYAVFLPWIMGKGQAQIVNEEQMDILNHMNLLRQSLHERDLTECLSAATYFLGRGRGLTPSGDDMLAGLIFFLSRCAPSLFSQNLSRGLIELAKEKTTTISANLMEAASYGQADERLVGVVDGLIGAPMNDLQAASEICSLGNSTGVDMLAGIFLALVETMGE